MQRMADYHTGLRLADCIQQPLNKFSNRYKCLHLTAAGISLENYLHLSIMLQYENAAIVV